jgi:hypothetical protein
MYLYRLNNEKLDPLLHEACNITNILDTHGTYSWLADTLMQKNVSEEIGINVKLTDEYKTLKQTNKLKP